MATKPTKTAASRKSAEAKPAATTKRTRTAAKGEAKPNGKPTTLASFRYQGSVAEQMDQALLKGGSYEELAASIIGSNGKPISPGTLRAHARFRSKSGKYRLEEADDHVKLVPTEKSGVPEAGRVEPLSEIAKVETPKPTLRKRGTVKLVTA